MLNSCLRRFAHSEALYGVKALKVSSSFKTNGAYKQTLFNPANKYKFSSMHPESSKETTSFASDASKIDEFGHIKTNKIHGLTLEEFVSYIKSAEDKADIDYQYKNKAIYALSGGIKDRPQISKITFDKAFWKTMYAFEALIWIPLSYVAYAYLSPYAVAFPLIGFAVTVGGTMNAQSLMENSIMRMDLIDNQQIMLYQWGNQGKGVACNIKDAKITRAEVPPPKKPSANEENPEENRQSASIEATFIDASSQKPVKAVFLVSPGSSPIENVNLFKMILQGRDSEISKFEFAQEPPAAKTGQSAENTQENIQATQ